MSPTLNSVRFFLLRHRAIARGCAPPWRISDGASGHDVKYTVDADGAGPSAPFTMFNRDFNFRSLRGNAVFRWEYNPGSTLYLVWTQERTDQSAAGNFEFSRDRTALLTAHPDNIFLVMLSYWLGR